MSSNFFRSSFRKYSLKRHSRSMVSPSRWATVLAMVNADMPSKSNCEIGQQGALASRVKRTIKDFCSEVLKPVSMQKFCEEQTRESNRQKCNKPDVVVVSSGR